MKTKNILALLAGVLFYVLITFIVFSYGNMINHPAINKAIVDGFVGRYIPKFAETYRFDFASPSLIGKEVRKSVMFWGDYEQGTATKSPVDWISHGGMSADVPEVQASVRHFYDPTQPEEERYLMDVNESFLVGFAQEGYPNPHINGLDWALIGDEGLLSDERFNHEFTWERGKQFMIEALQTKELGKKSEKMAYAWRALGETLHMIADHGCPAHVRDDSHPAPMGGKILGDPDPYEEIMHSDFNSYIAGWATNNVDPKIKAKFEQATTVRQIAHDFAVWTNENFFTNQTISGTNLNGNPIIPFAHPNKVYNSPKAAENIYNESDKCYHRTVGGIDVKLCKDTRYFWRVWNIRKGRGYPYIDRECVKSSAQALIPTIREAGIHAMKLFIPKLKAEIQGLKEDGTFWGRVRHITDAEYTKEIIYQGYVDIFVNSGKYFMTSSANQDGDISEKFDITKLNDKDTVYFELEFGGVKVASNKVVFKKKKDEDSTISDDINISRTDDYGFEQRPFTVTGTWSLKGKGVKIDHISNDPIPYLSIHGSKDADLEFRVKINATVEGTCWSDWIDPADSSRYKRYLINPELILDNSDDIIYRQKAGDEIPVDNSSSKNELVLKFKFTNYVQYVAVDCQLTAQVKQEKFSKSGQLIETRILNNNETGTINHTVYFIEFFIQAE